MSINFKRASILMTFCIAASIGLLSLIPLSVPQGMPGTDKTHHFIAYAFLVLPIAIQSPRSLIWLIPMAAVFGGLIEIVQPYVNRFGEWRDFQADLFGIALGVFIGLGLRRCVPTQYRRQLNN